VAKDAANPAEETVESSPVHVAAVERLTASATPAEVAAAKARVLAAAKAAADRAPRPAPGRTVTDGSDPIDGAGEGVFGSDGEDTTEGQTIDLAATGQACSTQAWFHKRKLYFTPVYSSVWVQLYASCHESLRYCLGDGYVIMSAMPFVVGSWRSNDGDVQDWCRVDTSKAYYVSRTECLGYGSMQIITVHNDEIVVGWFSFC
jgi:hypothetical protein